MTIAAAQVGPQQYIGKYEAADSSASKSRHDVALILGAWGLGDLSEAACLIVSELVTNAVRHCHAQQPVEVVILRYASDGVRISVKDPCPTQVVRREAALDDEGGRGLLLVEAMALRWGSEALPQGKAVWAEIESM